MTEPLALLDTNICIYLIEGTSDPALARIEQYAPGEVVTSAICYAELVRGIDPADRQARSAVDDFFAIIPVVDFDRRAAEQFALIPFRRRSFDRLIAAHAMALGVTLVTNNPGDFVDVADLRTENWTLP